MTQSVHRIRLGKFLGTAVVVNTLYQDSHSAMQNRKTLKTTVKEENNDTTKNKKVYTSVVNNIVVNLTE